MPARIARQAITRRWREVTTYGVFAAVTVALGAPLASELVHALLSAAHFQRWSLAPALIGLLTVAWARRRSLFGRIAYSLRYPSAGVAAALGLAFLGTFWLLSPDAWKLVAGSADAFALSWNPLHQIVLVLAAVAIAGLWSLFSIRRSAARSDPGLPRSAELEPASSASAFERLFRDDDPITTETDDRFDFMPIARRIADRLNEAAGRVPSMAVVGPLGSGKTSLMGLVRSLLDSDPKNRLRVVHVSTWGYEDPKAAVAGILDKIVAAIITEVGSISVRDLADEYVAALEGLGTFGRLSRLLRRGQSRTDVLERIDEIALAIDVRFVVWIDDLERFAATDHDKETADERARLAPVRALLRQLEDLTSVGVIVASTAIDRGFDFEKIARYIEELPRLPLDEARTMLEQAQKFWREEEAKAGVINGATLVPSRKASLRDDDEDEDHGGRIPGSSIDWDYLAPFCTTPRVLKHGLRECHRVWKELRGEINSDDVLVLSIIRASEPAAFRLLSVMRSSFTFLAEHRDHAWQSFINNLYDPGSPVVHQKALEGVAENMFHQRARLQGVGVLGPRDYWNRYLTAAKPTGADCDQPLIAAWSRFVNKDDPTDVVNKLIEQRTTEMEYFCVGINAGRMLRLFDALCDRGEGLRLHPKNKKRRPPGWLALWRLARKTVSSEAGQDRLLERIRARMPEMVRVNLAVAFFFSSHFAYVDSKDRDLFSPDRRSAIHSSLLDELAAAYGDKPHELAQALAHCERFAIRALLFEFAAAPPSWAIVGRALVQAAEADWEFVLPQLAMILIAKDLAYAPRGEGLFDSPRSDLLKLFVNRKAPPSWEDGSTSAVLDLAAEARGEPPHDAGDLPPSESPDRGEQP